jgi:hypothetical protein
MSSFTPRLIVPELVSLDVDDEDKAKKNGTHQHPQTEQVEIKLDKYLHAIRGFVNGVEHSKIKSKFDRRLSKIKGLPKTINLSNLICMIKAQKAEVIEKPNDVFEITKKLVDEFEKYKPINSKSTSQSTISNSSTSKVSYFLHKSTRIVYRKDYILLCSQKCLLLKKCH